MQTECYANTHRVVANEHNDGISALDDGRVPVLVSLPRDILDVRVRLVPLPGAGWILLVNDHSPARVVAAAAIVVVDEEPSAQTFVSFKTDWRKAKERVCKEEGKNGCARIEHTGK